MAVELIEEPQKERCISILREKISSGPITWYPLCCVQGVSKAYCSWGPSSSSRTLSTELIDSPSKIATAALTSATVTSKSNSSDEDSNLSNQQMQHHQQNRQHEIEHDIHAICRACIFCRYFPRSFHQTFARGEGFGQQSKVMSCFLSSPPSINLYRLGLYYSIWTLQLSRIRHFTCGTCEVISLRDPC